MADNATLPATGISVATDEIGGVHYQKMKVGFGGNDAYTAISTTDPLPVHIENTVVSANLLNSSFTNSNLNVYPATDRPATPTITAITASSTSQDFVIQNSYRMGAVIYNNADKDLYLLYGTTVPSSSNFTIKLSAGDALVLERNDFKGKIKGVWESGATGTAMVTEYENN